MSLDAYTFGVLGALADELVATKAAELLTRNARADVENRIAALIPTKDTGQKTVTLPEGVKLTIKRGLNYKTDTQAIEKIFNELDQFAPLKSKTTVELDIKGYEYYRREEPEFFGLLSQHVTVTPKKVAVTIKAK